jgi:hypothetical protein
MAQTPTPSFRAEPRLPERRPPLPQPADEVRAPRSKHAAACCQRGRGPRARSPGTGLAQPRRNPTLALHGQLLEVAGEHGERHVIGHDDAAPAQPWRGPALALHGQLLEVVGEHGERDVVGHDDLAGRARVRGAGRAVVCAARVELGQQEARLRRARPRASASARAALGRPPRRPRHSRRPRSSTCARP